MCGKSFIKGVCNYLQVINMEREFHNMVQEIDQITRDLDRTQKEITKEIVRKLSSIQDLLRQEQNIMQKPRREVILEKQRVIVRDNGETVFDGLRF
jgi:hypothetical protein